MNSLLTKLKTKVYKPLIDSCSGLALSILNPFKKGDFIEIDGQLGSVENRGIRRTAIKTPDGSISTVSNSKFYFKQLHNLSSENIIRLDIKITVTLETDMSRLKSHIIEFLNSNTQILSSPKPQIQVTKIQKEHIDLVIKPWCLLDDFLELDTRLEGLLIKHLERKSIEIGSNHSIIPERKLMAS